MISVSTSSVSTVSGIHVNSTEAEVLATYPGQIEVRGSEIRSLVYHAQDSHLRNLAVVFWITNSMVASMQAGLASIVEGDELCA